MKNRQGVCSILLMLAMCLSMLPQAAMAADLNAEQSAQISIEENDPQPTGDEGNGGGEGNAVVLSVQAMIDALPEEITVEDADSIAAALAAIDGEMAALTDNQRAALDVSRYEAALTVPEEKAANEAEQSENADADAVSE